MWMTTWCLGWALQQQGDQGQQELAVVGLLDCCLQRTAVVQEPWMRPAESPAGCVPLADGFSGVNTHTRWACCQTPCGNVCLCV